MQASAKGDDVAMAAKASDLTKRMVDSLDTLTKEITKLTGRIEKIEKQPAPAKGPLKVVGKEDDGGASMKKQELDPEKATAKDLIKAAHSKPLTQI